MKLWIGRGAGRVILDALRQAKRKVLVISPWISGDVALLLRDLSRRIDVRVVTLPEGNPGLEPVMKKYPAPKRVIVEVVLIAAGVAVLHINLVYSVPIFLAALLFVPFIFKKKLPSWVKTLPDLHAKIYVVDDRVFFSSANLTRGGVRKNLEFVLELSKDELGKEWKKINDLQLDTQNL